MILIKKKNPYYYGFLRGDNQIRTGDQGVADPRLTAWLCRHILFYTLKQSCLNKMTPTRFELVLPP